MGFAGPAEAFWRRKDSSRTMEASIGGIAVPARAAAICRFICRLPSMRRSEWLMSPLRDIVCMVLYGRRSFG